MLKLTDYFPLYHTVSISLIEDKPISYEGPNYSAKIPQPPTWISN